MNDNTMCKKHPHRFRAVVIQHLVGLAVVGCMLTQTCYLKAAPQVPKKKNAKEEKPKRLTPEELAEIWTKIRTAEAPKSPDIEEGSVDYWGDILTTTFQEFKKIIMSSNQRQGLEFYVNQFGKHGAQADMRWLITMRSWTINVNSRPRPRLLHNANNLDLRLRRAQIILAEIQVRQFLKSPKLLARYYQTVIWFNRMFSEGYFPVLLGKVYRNMNKESKEDDYWFYAQNFVLMAHATGRDDLLKGVKPEDLKPRFQQWYQWFMQNGMYLRASPDTFYWALKEKEKKVRKVYFPFLEKQRLPPLKVLPIYPFPDWKGPKPTTPKNYRDME